MTQKEINLIYNLTITIHIEPWFKNKSREEVQEWVREQLAEYNIFTIPMGMSWGVLCNKESYKKHI